MRGQHRRFDQLLQCRWRQVVDRKLLHHLGVFDVGIHAFLVPVDQFLDRTRQVLVCRNDRHQGSDVEPAHNRQVTTHQIKKERRDLRQQVVDELDQKLALEVLEPDQEQPPQPRRKLSALIVRGVMCMNLDHTIHTFGDSPGQLAGGYLPFTRQHQEAATHFWHDDRLDNHHGERHQPKVDMLEEDEKQGRESLASQKQRRYQGLADKPAQWLDLIVDHRRHLGRLDAAEVRNRKPQNVVEQVITQAAQHAFAHPALHGVDLQLDEAADDDHQQKGKRQCQQIFSALKRKTIKQTPRGATEKVRQGKVDAQKIDRRVRVRETFALDRLVDDVFREVQRYVIKQHRQHHQRHDQQLVTPAVLEDEPE